MNKRLSFKSTEAVIDVMTVVANNRHGDIADLVHNYFYGLAILDWAEVNGDVEADVMLDEIFKLT